MGDNWFDQDTADMGQDQEVFDHVDPVEQLVIRREVTEPMHVKLEAHVMDTGTFLKFWHVPRGEAAFTHMLIDDMEPELLINALVERFEEGRYWEVVKFIQDEGRAIRDPIEFRLKLDASMGLTGPDIMTGLADDEPLF